MKISEKITQSNDEIMSDIDGAGGELANKLGDLATEAMFDGINSRKWEEYMKTYASNKQQLDRLCGDEATYLANDENKRTLAYIVGNSICTVDTRLDGDDHHLGTLNYLTPKMIEALDAGFPDTSESPKSESK